MDNTFLEVGKKKIFILIFSIPQALQRRRQPTTAGGVVTVSCCRCLHCDGQAGLTVAVAQAATVAVAQAATAVEVGRIQRPQSRYRRAPQPSAAGSGAAAPLALKDSEASTATACPTML